MYGNNLSLTGQTLGCWLACLLAASACAGPIADARIDDESFPINVVSSRIESDAAKVRVRLEAWSDPGCQGRSNATGFVVELSWPKAQPPPLRQKIDAASPPDGLSIALSLDCECSETEDRTSEGKLSGTLQLDTLEETSLRGQLNLVHTGDIPIYGDGVYTGAEQLGLQWNAFKAPQDIDRCRSNSADPIRVVR